jgi:hypothetical protein
MKYIIIPAHLLRNGSVDVVTNLEQALSLFSYEIDFDGVVTASVSFLTIWKVGGEIDVSLLG